MYVNTCTHMYAYIYVCIYIYIYISTHMYIGRIAVGIISYLHRKKIIKKRKNKKKPTKF